MPNLSRTPDEIARLGKALYDREIRGKVERDHHGQVVVIDVDTGEYEIASEHFTAASRARAKHPDATLFAVRVGYPALARIGGSHPWPQFSPPPGVAKISGVPRLAPFLGPKNPVQAPGLNKAPKFLPHPPPPALDPLYSRTI